MKPLTKVVLVLAIAAAAWSRFSAKAGGGSGKAPDLDYTDTKGGYHSLASSKKPAVVVMWVTPCPYCARALNVMDSLRRKYPEENLDLVGFYLNKADSATVEQIARQEGHVVMVAQGQPTGDFVQALTNTLGFRGPGRDIFVIGKDGKFEAVDASNLAVPDYQIELKLREILRVKHGLADRAG